MTNRREVTTSTQEEFFKRMGRSIPNHPKIDRSIISPEELKLFDKYFSTLCTDLTIYKQLFSIEESIEVLNSFSSIIFGRIQSTYIERICLKIACLLDPAESGRNGINKNLTLKRFASQCNSAELNTLIKNLDALYNSTGIKTWRNKVLAHSDLKTAMGEFDFDLKFTLEDLENIIQCIQEIVDLIVGPNVTTDTEVVLPYGNDVGSFIAKLKKCNNVEKKRRHPEKKRRHP